MRAYDPKNILKPSPEALVVALGMKWISHIPDDSSVKGSTPTVRYVFE